MMTLGAHTRGPLGPAGAITRILGRSPAELAEPLALVRNQIADAAAILPHDAVTASGQDVVRGTTLLRAAMDTLTEMKLGTFEFGYGANGVGGWGAEDGADIVTTLGRRATAVEGLESALGDRALPRYIEIPEKLLGEAGYDSNDVRTLFEDVNGLANVARAVADGTKITYPTYDGRAFSAAVAEAKARLASA